MAESLTRRIGDRYMLHGVLASGGMATVHFGRLRGPVGFSRTVAIKQLLPQYATDPDFVGMFVDEARIAARIRHPNVVPTLEVVTEGQEIFIVMEYVHGESFGRLLRRASEDGTRIPTKIGCAIVRDMLSGLQAAHDAKDERGAELGIIHRDVSPQNTIVGVDGSSRLLDFGVAKARGRSQVTREGQLKGKLAYMAPEQLLGHEMTHAVDVFAAAVVLWEALTGRRLFHGESEGQIVHRILMAEVPAPSSVDPGLRRFDDVVARGLARDPQSRYPSARAFAQALAAVEDLADAAAVGDWVSRAARESLVWRAARLAEVERDSVRPAATDAVSPSNAASESTPGSRDSHLPQGSQGSQASQGSSVNVQALTHEAVVAHETAGRRWAHRALALGAGALLSTIVVGAARNVSSRPVRALSDTPSAALAASTDVLLANGAAPFGAIESAPPSLPSLPSSTASTSSTSSTLLDAAAGPAPSAATSRARRPAAFPPRTTVHRPQPPSIPDRL